MGRYPALEIHAVDPDLVLAVLDDHAPAAVEDHEDGIRVFFTRAEDRDHAATAVLGAYPAAQVVAVDVDDEDWARRSQADLKPVTIGRITIVPSPGFRPSDPGSNTITIQPSMGFGTGHHATTRLCVAALQTVDLDGKSVLDVGTGSGVLAIAADLLGAASALGIDHDTDAIASARENLELNPAARHVTFDVAELRQADLRAADVVCANLTGALLVAASPLLTAAVKTGGVLIVSGLLEEEEQAVREAFAPAAVSSRAAEQGWVVLTLHPPIARTARGAGATSNKPGSSGP